jgi:glycosyltransferase involved in cell wall biosynthesis
MKICHLTSVHKRHDIRIFMKECVSLTRAGFDVSLVVADGGEDEIREGVKIRAVPKEKSRLKRLFLTARRVYKKALALDADVYHFHDPELLPYGNKLQAKGKKVIYDSHEDLPRALLSKPYLWPFVARILSRLLESYENRSARRYAAVVTATPFINQRFLQINPNSININNYPLLKEFDLEQSFQVGSKPLCKIAYVGGITKIRGLSFVVEAIGNSKAFLQLAGPVNPAGYMEELKVMPGWKKVSYHGNVSREQVKEIFSKSVAGIVTFLPEPNHINAQPNKLFEYMSSGLPVIASHYPLWKRIIEGHDCGICVDPENSQAISEAIDYLVEYPERASDMGKNGRKAVQEHFNWETEQKKLVTLYKNLQK